MNCHSVINSFVPLPCAGSYSFPIGVEGVINLVTWEISEACIT